MLSYQNLKPRIDDKEKNESLSKVVNSKTLLENDLLKLLNTAPSLCLFIDKEKWNYTLAHFVALNHPEYFVQVPVEIITPEMYELYLLNGAKKLTAFFRPIVYEELLTLRSAIFLLRVCAIITNKFKANSKYKYHFEKAAYKYADSGFRTYNDLSIISDKLVKNLEKYVGKKDSFDAAISSYFFQNTDTVSEEFLDKLVALTPFAESLRYLHNTIQFQEYLIKKYDQADVVGKNEIFLKVMKSCYIDTADECATHDWQYKYTHFYKTVIDKYLTIDVTFKDNSTITLRDEKWLTKTLIRHFKNIFNFNK